MRKIATALIAALTIAACSTPPAYAADLHWRGHRHWHHARVVIAGTGLTGTTSINGYIRAPYYFTPYSFYGWGPYPCAWHNWHGYWERDCL